MENHQTELENKRRELIERLEKCEEFRRGTINVFHRKCGKKGCACNQDGHPGHGPQTTLTFKDKGKTKSKNLPTSAAVRLVERQIQNHDFFRQWSKEWIELNEELADIEFDRIVSASTSAPKDPDQKKSRRRSRRKSSGKSRG